VEFFVGDDVGIMDFIDRRQGFPFTGKERHAAKKQDDDPGEAA